jgi:predicted negative regulator of RcsB-dependent stress response
LQAASEGVLKLATSIGRVRDAMQAALEAEPDWFPARSGVVEFYLLAPGLLGGSTAKALETARAATRPEQTRALQARVALQDKQYDTALQALAGVQAPADSALADSVHGWTTAAAFGLVNAGQATRAQPLFERLSRDRPGDARPVFGLARVQAEAGAHQAALQLLAQAAKLQGATELPLDYRAGIAHQALGQTDAARAALQRFVGSGKGNKGNVEDARKRLEQLGT